MRFNPTLSPALAVAAAALALSACGDNSTDSDPETETVAPGEMSDTGLPDAGAGTVAMAPQEFVQTMAASDRFEIEAARVMQGKSPPAGVRDFAAMMIRDHGASTDRLKQAVGSDGAVSMPATATLSAAQQTQLDQLRSASGAEAAALYMRQQVTAHEMALSTLSAFAANGAHDGLKRFAAETANAVRTHLDHARTLEGAGTAGGETGNSRGAASRRNNPNGPGTSAPGTGRGTSAGTGTDTAPVGPTGAPPPR